MENPTKKLNIIKLVVDEFNSGKYRNLFLYLKYKREEFVKSSQDLALDGQFDRSAMYSVKAQTIDEILNLLDTDILLELEQLRKENESFKVYD